MSKLAKITKYPHGGLFTAHMDEEGNHVGCSVDAFPERLEVTGKLVHQLRDQPPHRCVELGEVLRFRLLNGTADYRPVSHDYATDMWMFELLSGGYVEAPE